ncbi:hypothetical protein HZH66_009101 [Vespula vulgaris]|uniref:Uncharacterized protein n=1 Tax=Vespula vulgaris TaxID=7454 RepID=A0A834JQV9_VESVU|nr:hypothetical protein HZH66_009101 [Vespula vulgaris]
MYASSSARDRDAFAWLRCSIIASHPSVLLDIKEKSTHLVERADTKESRVPVERNVESCYPSDFPEGLPEIRSTNDYEGTNRVSGGRVSVYTRGRARLVGNEVQYVVQTTVMAFARSCDLHIEIGRN